MAIMTSLPGGEGQAKEGDWQRKGRQEDFGWGEIGKCWNHWSGRRDL